MGKARTLGQSVSTGGPLANGDPAIANVTGLQAALDGKLATTAGAVGSTNLATGAVTSAKIAAGAVDTAALADSNVTTGKLANSAVTLAKMADVATATVLGRNTAGTGSPEALSAATARALIGADNASNLTSGTVAPARLGSGSPGTGNFLRGDGTWQAVSTTPTTDQVLSATAGASVGAVGTYAIMSGSNGSNFASSPGSTAAGSNLRFSNAMTRNSQGGGGAASGTWRCMGQMNTNGPYNTYETTLWLRIS